MALAAERLVGAAAALVAAAGLLTVGYRVGAETPSVPRAVGDAPSSPSPSPSPVPTPTMPALFVDLPAWQRFHDTLVVLEEKAVWRRASGLAPAVVMGLASTGLQSWTRLAGGNVVVARNDEGEVRGRVTWVPLDGAARRLPEDASEALPAFGGRDVWLVSYEMANDVQRGTAWLTHPGTGTVRRRVELPPFSEVAGAARGGLVLNLLEPAREGIVWSPDSRTQVRSLDGLVADVNGPYALVSVESADCVPRCHFVVETATGKRTRLRGLDDAVGPPALSPDGQWAVDLVRYGRGLSELRAVDVSTGIAYAAPRATSSTPYRILWSRDSRTAYVSLRFGERWQTIAWRPGTWDIGTVVEGSWGSALPE